LLVQDPLFKAALGVEQQGGGAFTGLATRITTASRTSWKSAVTLRRLAQNAQAG
jgi:hypothetical protein